MNSSATIETRSTGCASTFDHSLRSDLKQGRFDFSAPLLYRDAEDSYLDETIAPPDPVVHLPGLPAAAAAVVDAGPDYQSPARARRRRIAGRHARVRRPRTWNRPSGTARLPSPKGKIEKVTGYHFTRDVQDPGRQRLGVRHPSLGSRSAAACTPMRSRSRSRPWSRRSA